MSDKLLAIFKCSGAIVINLFVVNLVQANPREYVFTAPPEVDYELVEIPASDKDYPLYECDQKLDQTKSAIGESHNCDHLPPDSNDSNSEKKEQLPSQNQQKYE